MTDHIVLSDITIQIDADGVNEAQSKVRELLEELADEEEVEKIQIDRLKGLPPRSDP